VIADTKYQQFWEGVESRLLRFQCSPGSNNSDLQSLVACVSLAGRWHCPKPQLEEPSSRYGRVTGNDQNENFSPSSPTRGVPVERILPKFAFVNAVFGLPRTV
jgi:hypothetical protein